MNRAKLPENHLKLKQIKQKNPGKSLKSQLT